MCNGVPGKTTAAKVAFLRSGRQLVFALAAGQQITETFDGVPMMIANSVTVGPTLRRGDYSK